MSVNISTSKLHFRVGRPEPLTSTIHHQYFPHLQLENGWRYFTVCKQATNNTQKEEEEDNKEVHCLKVKNNENSDYVNEMLWYCNHCFKFPCQWRVRQRHLKTCTQPLHSKRRNHTSPSMPSFYSSESLAPPPPHHHHQQQQQQYQQFHHHHHQSDPVNHHHSSSPSLQSNNVFQESGCIPLVNQSSGEESIDYNIKSPTSQWIDELLLEFSTLEINNSTRLSEIEHSLMSLSIDSSELDQLHYYYSLHQQNQHHHHP